MRVPSQSGSDADAEHHGGRTSFRAIGPGVFALALLFGVAVGCEEEPTAIDDLDTVVTLYDGTVEFDDYATYAMPDSIVHFGSDTTQQLSREHDQVILGEIAAQMTQAGYVRVTDPEAEPPDLVVLAGATSTAHVGYATYTADYWAWWSGWGWYAPFDPTWSFYYPWYTTTVAYVYRVGTILIDVIDPLQRDNDRRLVGSLWIGAVNGVLGNATEAETRIRDGIAQAFEQSPYLRAGGPPLTPGGR